MTDNKPEERPPAANVADEDADENAQLNISKEEIIPEMAADEFYPDNHVEKVFPDSSLSKRHVEFFACFG